jgi:hypothetical protein
MVEPPDPKKPRVRPEMTSTPSFIARETAFETGGALILGGSSPNIVSIRRALGLHFKEVSVENALPPADHRKNFSLIVVTDAVEPAPDREFAGDLRRHYPRAKVIGIFDKFDPEVEIAMRSAGIVFWGSHERFSAHCEEILQTVLSDRVNAETA